MHPSDGLSASARLPTGAPPTPLPRLSGSARKAQRRDSAAGALEAPAELAPSDLEGVSFTVATPPAVLAGVAVTPNAPEDSNKGDTF
eukprot:8406540-Pyramimonas_sp.AAC.1